LVFDSGGEGWQLSSQVRAAYVKKRNGGAPAPLSISDFYLYLCIRHSATDSI